MIERFINFVVSNRLFTSLFILIVILTAWVQLPNLKISQYPSVELPTLMINITLPGASAKEIEQRVITELEEKLESTRNLSKFKTAIHNSYANITVEYHYGVDIDDEVVDINSKINSLKPDLPSQTEITVSKQSPVDLMVSFVLAVVSETASDHERLVIAELLKNRLRMVNAIDETELIKAEEEVRIDLDLARMKRYGITVQQIRQSIQGNNRFLPTGTFTFGDKAISVLAFSGGFKDIEALRDTMLISSSGSALALRDVATVHQHIVPDAVITRVNGKQASLLTLKMSNAANVFTVKKELDTVVEEVRQQISGDTEIKWLFSVEEGVGYKLQQLITNILQGILILTVVLLLSVGYRSALIIALMLPTVLFLSVVGLSLTDYGLQQISLAGFIISLGLIVDNGIVVTENAYKLQYFKNYDKRRAAVIGTSSVMAPLMSATLTTALAFAPLFFLTSMTGLFLRSMMVTIWLCLGASLVVAVTFSTLTLSRFGTNNDLWVLPKLPSFMRALKPICNNQYADTLQHLIAKPWKLVLIIIALFVITGLAASRLNVIVFPDSEEPFLTVSIEAPRDRSADYVDKLSREIYTVAARQEGVEFCSTVVGNGFPFVDTGIPMVQKGRNNAILFCRVDFRDSRRIAALADKVNLELAHLSPYAIINASPFAVGGQSGSSDVEVELSGPRIESVREIAAELEQQLVAANIAGIRTMDNPAKSRWFALDIRFKERVANALGVSRAQVDEVLVLITQGSEVDDFRDGSGEEFPIVLRAEENFEEPLAVFDRIFVTSTRGENIPLSQVIEVSFSEDEYDIDHEAFRPAVTIGIEGQPGVSVAQLTQDVQAATAKFKLPQGYVIEFKGELANTEEAFGDAGKYVGIVALVILGIFVLQFKSLMQPLVICAAIPLSFIGGFLLLWLVDEPMSFLAFIGLTSLMGIVVNNAILLVDEGNQLRRLDPSRRISEVAVQAGINRFMPIVLTSVTSIFGLLPLAVGNSMFKALAIVVIGGLGTSTFLTLFCVPVLYTYLTRESVPIPDAVTKNWSGRSALGEEKE